MALALLSGERISLQRGTGMAMTFFGLVLAAISFLPEAKRGDASPPRDTGGARLSKGAGWAIIAAIGYGVMFWWLGVHVVPAGRERVSVWVVS